MIDQTNRRIGQATAELRRRKAREQKFDRLLLLTDVVLWQLEEMNRDGVAHVPDRRQAAIADKLAEMLCTLHPSRNGTYLDFNSTTLPW